MRRAKRNKDATPVLPTGSTTLTPKDFKGKALFIASPAYGGMLTSEYAIGVCSLVTTLNNFKVKSRLGIISNESLIPRARNVLIAQFIASEEYSHLIFIDVDIEFRVADIFRMLYYDRDILCGGCPFKELPQKYVIETTGELEEDRFPVLHNAGTGFMMIKREVILKMFEAYPDLKYDFNESTIKASTVPNIEPFAYTLFDTGVEKLEDGKIQYLSEDYLFCRRWQKIGGKVLLDTETMLHHLGRYKYLGRELTGLVN